MTEHLIDSGLLSVKTHSKQVRIKQQNFISARPKAYYLDTEFIGDKNMKNLRISGYLTFLTLTIGLLLTLVSSASAATFVVNDLNDVIDATPGNGVCETATGNGICTLRAAITEANTLAGADIITLPAGTYTQTLVGTNEDVNANGDWDITTDITVNGAGSGTTILQANAAPLTATERVLHIIGSGSFVTLNDITFQNGNPADAGSSVSAGGGIRVQGGSATAVTTFNRVVVQNNHTGWGGGGIAAASNDQTITINNSTINANTAGDVATGANTCHGAGIAFQNRGKLNLTNSTVSNNVLSASASPSLTFGGGISMSVAQPNTAVITGSSISNNSIGSVPMTSNTGSFIGGGIFSTGTTITISGSTISGNSVGGSAGSLSGGGLYFRSTSTVETAVVSNTTISGNSARQAGGVAVNAQGGTVNATFTNTTINGNTATLLNGGGLESTSSLGSGFPTVNMTNSTVSGNSAVNGAGIYSGFINSIINLNYVTVASNTATTNGGGLNNGGGTINLKNSIVADNGAVTGPDISGTITSQDYNHVENTSGGTFFTSDEKTSKPVATFFVLPNDVTGTDPMLGALALNGGTRMNHLPANLSPVTNTIPNGTSDCGVAVTTSQSALTRPQQTGCEKGAAERLASLAAASLDGRVATANGVGIRNAIVEISGGSLTQPIQRQTGSFGYFRFTNLEVGQTYVITIYSKRFQFANPSRVITLNESVSHFDFIAEPQLQNTNAHF